MTLAPPSSRSIQTRKQGHPITIHEGHEIASEVKNTLQKAQPAVFSVLVHIEPATDQHLIERGISDQG